MSYTRRGYTVEDLFRVKTVTEAQVSPDGGQVAYVAGEIDREADGYRSAIWLAAMDGRGARQLTSGARSEGQPRWSPDGRWLAFTSNRAGDPAQLYVLPAMGGEAHKLTNLARGVQEMAWSPDSAAIAVTSRVGGTPPDKANSAPRVITDLKHKFNGRGFFDGSHLHIFTVDLTGGEPRQITEGEWDNSQIAWSPDSSSIVFVSARHETRDRDQGQDIWMVAARGPGTSGAPDGERRLTDGFGPCNAPTISPDGATIAFVGHTDTRDLGGRVHALWLLPAGGGQPRNVTPTLDLSLQAGPLNPGAPPARIVWTNDGGALIVRIQDGADTHLYHISAADGALSRLLGGERTVESFSVAEDGTLACAISDPTHPSAVYTAAHDGSGERRLTDHNDGLLAELRFPAIEAVRVPVAGGATIEGWVIKPLDMEPGRAYPLVLDIHGGPHAAFLHAFRGSYPLALASAGCAVLQMNPRGSTGWGEDFARYLHGGRGERDLPELMAAVDQVIAQGWIDTERLGVTGYSYGGYMTAWAISQTNRFAAAVWGAGTANLYTHFGYSDLNVPRYAEMAGSPWEKRELYLRQSPISHVDRIRTPLLMLHGEADLRCNPAQADEFFTALKYFGVETVLVRYPGENHMMRTSGKPSNRLDYDQRLIAWFAERLVLTEQPAIERAATEIAPVARGGG